LVIDRVPVFEMPPARLPDIELCAMVKVPALLMPAPEFPVVMVTPEIATATPVPMVNTVYLEFPLIVRLEDPGPLIITFLLIESVPLVSVIVAG
jgi:hypothetical protein